MTQDYRKGQKVIATIELEDQGQDFLELDVLENGVILGNNAMFSMGRISILGVGTLDGVTYYPFWQFALKCMHGYRKFNSLSIYVKGTGSKDVVPWQASVFKYKIVDVREPVEVNRFVNA